MGLALADEAARRGAEVTLVAANVDAAARRPACAWSRCETAAELLAAARAAFADADVLLMAAAVADFRPGAGARRTRSRRPAATAWRSSSSPPRTCWRRCRQRARPGQTLVGFAAEHGEGAVERGRGEARAQGPRRRRGQRHLALGHRLRLRRQRGDDRHRGGRAARAAGLQGRRRRGDPRRGRGAANRGGGAPPAH